MKKIIFGQFFRFLIIVSSISILAACGASDALDLVNDIDNPGGGTETYGSVTISGPDISSIGDSFEPTVENFDEPSTGLFLASFGDADVDIGTLSAVGRILGVTFSANGTPIGIAFGANLTNGDIDYAYSTVCDVNDCSGIDINTTTNVITLNNVIVFVETDGSSNAATSSVTLNGSVTYVSP